MRATALPLLLICVSACATSEGPNVAAKHPRRQPPAAQDDLRAAQKAARAYHNRKDSAELRGAYFDAVARLPHTTKTRRLRLEAEHERLITTFKEDTEPYEATVNLLDGKRVKASTVGDRDKRAVAFTAERDHCYVMLTGNHLFSGLSIARGNHSDLQQFKGHGFHGFCASADASVKAWVPERQNEDARVLVIDVTREQFPPVLAYYAEPKVYDTLSNCADDAFIGYFTHPIPGTLVYDDDGPVLLTKPLFGGHPEGYHLATGLASRVKHLSRTKTGETGSPLHLPPSFSCWSITSPTTPATRAIGACTNRVGDSGYAAREAALRSGKSGAYANQQRFNAESAINGSCEALIERHKAGFLKKLQTLASSYEAPAMSEALWNAVAADRSSDE